MHGNFLLKKIQEPETGVEKVSILFVFTHLWTLPKEGSCIHRVRVASVIYELRSVVLKAPVGIKWNVDK